MTKKELMETIEDCKAEMQSIVDKAAGENRTLTEEETKQFSKFETKAKDYKNTLEKMEEVEDMNKTGQKLEDEGMTQEEKDVKAFAQIVRTGVQNGPNAAENNITYGDNGAIIPKTIANKIIDRVKEISPLFGDAQQFNAKGTLSIPYVDQKSDNITVAYADEFTELESKATKLKSIDLSGYLAGVLCKVSKSLINNTDIALTNFVVNKMAAAFAEFVEHEILIGTVGKATGLSTATNVVTAAAANAVTADELIKLQDSMKSAYQGGAYWVMNPATLTAIRTLKGVDNTYLLNPDYREGFGYTILGKTVYTSDQMPTLAAGNAAVAYVNPAEALAVKTVEGFEIQTLLEKFATQHAVGFVGWTEFDAKIQNEQAVAVLKMKTA